MRIADSPHAHITRRTILIWALVTIVYDVARRSPVSAQLKAGNGRATASAPPPQVIVGRGVEGLPPAVADMRAAIIAAIETGDIAELRGAMDLNELPPEVGAPVGTGPVEYLRSLSTDGTGKDILVAIGALLEGTWAAIPGGRDAENNRIYVWPSFAETGVGSTVGSVTAQQDTALAELVGEEAAATMRQQGRYRGWRLSIGADGVWHMLTRVGE